METSNIDFTYFTELWKYYNNQNQSIKANSYFQDGNKNKESIYHHLIQIMQEKIYSHSNYKPIHIFEPKPKNPIKIGFIGDIHGNFADCRKIIKYCTKKIEKSKNVKAVQYHFVFLGDYVDRSKVDTHTLFYIFLLKLR